MEEARNVPEKKCSHCKAAIPREATFCPFCGKKSGSISMVTIVVALVILLVLALLASTNPRGRNFEDYVAGKVNAGMKEKSGSGNLFEQFAGRAAGMTASKMTRRDNYVLFSLFEFDASYIRLIKPDFPRVRFLGIAGRIIPLSKVNLDELSAPSAAPAQPPAPPSPPQDQQGVTGSPQPTPVTPGVQGSGSQPGNVPPPAYNQTPPPPPDAAATRRQKEADYQSKMAEHLRKLREAGKNR
jgi:hypothetical protein